MARHKGIKYESLQPLIMSSRWATNPPKFVPQDLFAPIVETSPRRRFHGRALIAKIARDIVRNGV